VALKLVSSGLGEPESALCYRVVINGARRLLRAFYPRGRMMELALHTREELPPETTTATSPPRPPSPGRAAG
jgi:hypothetical protein